ncbi:MAG TPA: glycosyltransferase [Polyangia bacterium]
MRAEWNRCSTGEEGGRPVGGSAVRDQLGVGAGPLLLCLARPSGDQGAETAVRALPLCGRDASLVVAVPGARAPALEGLAVALGVERALHLIDLDGLDGLDRLAEDRAVDRARLYSAADLILAPSPIVGVELAEAVSEAMAAGRPLVVSDGGELAELVGSAGLVVPPCDPAVLAGAITRLLDDPLLRARLGELARARAAPLVPVLG